ncbi:hypothetical protein [Nonomuraea sp. 10N515B]|uniref:hypothetical protein n=1 Tax=Nonomuraea sp. 10N515B TaxID=3457422 RepID=UPI003FCD97F9
MVAVDLTARMVVSAPQWNGGSPVRIQAVHAHGGRVAVRFQDARGRGGIRADWVEVGMELDLIDGGCIRRGGA